MKLALSNLAWNPADEPAAIALMQKYGFMGVEIAPTKVWPSPQMVSEAELFQYREHWNGQGIKIAALQSLLYGKPDLLLFDTPDEALLYLSAMTRIADGLGTNIMVLGSPKNRVGGDFLTAVGFFSIACKLGIPLCIEPNPVQYGCAFINTTEEAQELVAAVNHPNFRLHLDSGIMTLNGETEILPDIAHFHISQPYLSPVGPGTVEHIAMAAALRGINYKGWCSVEMLPCENLEKSLEYVAGIYGD